jgi:hypothetical protein
MVMALIEFRHKEGRESVLKIEDWQEIWEFCFDCVECDMSWTHVEVEWYLIGGWEMKLPCGTYQNQGLVKPVTMTIVSKKTMGQHWVRGTSGLCGHWKDKEVHIKDQEKQDAIYGEPGEISVSITGQLRVCVR